MDYKDNVVWMRCDRPAHVRIAEGKPKVRTCLSVIEARGGRLKLLVAEGESVPGPILEIGNTNSRYRFSIRVPKFANDCDAQGPGIIAPLTSGMSREKRFTWSSYELFTKDSPLPKSGLIGPVILRCQKSTPISPRVETGRQ
jgi:L-arabinose isomerase